MKNEEKIDLSLVLALYNEGSVLGQSLTRIFEVLDKSGLRCEIILIDDKSRDQTLKIARAAAEGRKNCLLIEHHDNVGRGGTVQEGFRRSRGVVIGYIDVDLEAGPEDMPIFAGKILKGEAEAIVGVRKYRVYFSTFLRFLLSRIYQLIVRQLLKIPFQDTESGYKFFLREKILPVLDQVEDKGWFWDTEIMALCSRANLKIKEFPVIFNRRLDKKSTVNVFKDSAVYLRKLIAFTFKKP